MGLAKWQIQGGFRIVPLPYWTGRASKKAASWFLPPLVFLGLINKVEILKISLSSLNIFHSVWLVLENLSVFKFVIWESSSPVLNFLACKLVKIGSNLSKLVQTCQYWLTFVQIGSKLLKLIQTCQKLFRFVQIGANLSTLFQRKVEII